MTESPEKLVRIDISCEDKELKKAIFNFISNSLDKYSRAKFIPLNPEHHDYIAFYIYPSKTLQIRWY